MMFKCFPLLLFCFFSNLLTLKAQQPAVQNITHKINESKSMVVILYDMLPTTAVDTFDVSIELSLNAQNIVAKGLSGDIGNRISYGYGKKIIWDVHSDIPELEGELKVNIIAVIADNDQIPAEFTIK